MEINVNELSGAALDWAVGTTLGKSMVIRNPIGQSSEPVKVWEQVGDHGGVVWFAPSVNWDQGGPLADRFEPDWQTGTNDKLNAFLHNNIEDRSPLIMCSGETYLIALCRVIVADRMGSVVNVPDELL